jgi:hypothetical protein
MVADVIWQDLADMSGAQSKENRIMTAKTMNIATSKDYGTLRMAGTAMPDLVLVQHGHIG